ncbi:cell division protein SepF [Synechococcus moorigangaii CMS01]|nr:cell division protein SepF [Synechococcus moorigangaii CMS01]
MFNSIRNFLGFNEQEEYEEYYEGEIDNTDYQALYPVEMPAPLPEEGGSAPRRFRENPTVATNFAMNSNSAPTRNNVIGLPGVSNSPAEVVVCEPRSFEEMPQIIQALRDRRSIVLNLNMMDPDEAQRAVDFVAGGTFAIDGHQERIGDSIFLFTPNCVQVTNQASLNREEETTTTAPVRPAAPTPAWNDEMPLAQAQ